MTFPRFVFLLALPPFFGGCGSTDPCADRRDLALSPAGLDLTAEEHPAGWGSEACFQCHTRWEIHAEDCIEGVALDVDAIEAETVDDCVSCHGWNGVPAWRDLDGAGR